MKMDSTTASRRLNPNQASAKSSQGPRLNQLGMKSTMSPSMMSSSGPSSENTAAYAPNQWGTGMHHSTSTPQMYPGGFEDNSGFPSSRYRSGPSTFEAPSDATVLSTSGAGHSGSKVRTVTNYAVGLLMIVQATTPNADFVRQTNLSHILEHSDGSPSRFLRTSPNPGNGSNVASARARPNNLGFGNIGEGLQVNNQQIGAGPKSAPAQVNTFEQAGSCGNRGPWNENMFDDRWLHHSQEMYVTDARRTSVLTISPDRIPRRTPQDSNISSAYPSSSHLDLLQAQYGMRDPARTGAHESIYPARHSSNQAYNAVSSSFPAQSQEASSAISLGRGYDTLRAYVEKAANGQ